MKNDLLVWLLALLLGWELDIVVTGNGHPPKPPGWSIDTVEMHDPHSEMITEKIAPQSRIRAQASDQIWPDTEWKFNDV